MRKALTRRAYVALLAGLGVLGAVGVGYAAIPGPDGVIHACYGTSPTFQGEGGLRVVDSAALCHSDERPLAWNQAGPRGATGPQGPPGPPGPSGTSAAYAASNVNDDVKVPIGILNPVTVLELDLPAGKYVVSASLDIRDSSDDVSFASCEIDPGDGNIPLNALDPGQTETFSIDGTVDFGGGKLKLRCITARSPATVATRSMTAIRVGSIN